MTTGAIMQTITTNATLERRGKTITTYVVYDAVQRLKEMNEGEILEVITDDYPAFPPDIAAWCEATGHRLVTTEPTADGLRFLLEKGPGVVQDTKLAMVISTAGLEELLSPLAFALAGALEGIDVHLYFQGPAVRVLARGFHPKLSGWGRPFSRMAAASMAKSGHIPPQEKLRQLRSLGAHFYMCAGSMDHFKVDKEDLIFDDLPLVEYLTFMKVMEESDIHIYN